MSNIRHDVLYDGQCGLCNAVVRFFIKRDQNANFHFLPMQDPPAQELMKVHRLEGIEDDTVVYVCSDHVYLRSEAAIRMLAQLGGTYRLSLILLLVPKKLRDFIYNLIAKNRHAWFRHNNKCSN